MAPTILMAYDALKAYLMMFHKEHFDAAFMQNWLMSNLSKTESSGMSDQQKKSVEKSSESDSFKTKHYTKRSL